MSEGAAEQECALHKTTHKGVKREDFKEQHHEALLNATMGLSMKLQRDVLWNCDCPANQAKFDGIVEEIKGTSSATSTN